VGEFGNELRRLVGFKVCVSGRLIQSKSTISCYSFDLLNQTKIVKRNRCDDERDCSIVVVNVLGAYDLRLDLLWARDVQSANRHF